jgi:hypothetical protein
VPLHPIELEQMRLNEEIPSEATVLETVAQVLGLDQDDEATLELVVRQLVEADRQSSNMLAAAGSVRRAAAGCGFIAGVTFAESVRRARAAEHG